jgi:hypothetical protein
MSISTQDQIESENITQDAWQERFLQRILILSAVVGLFAVIPAVIGTNEIILQSVYISVFVLLVATILIRLPYIVKGNNICLTATCSWA